MPADVNSAFDVAFVFADLALGENEYLQPQKLQRLLYIAQGYYGVAYKCKLMPAVFVADEMGPLEPNVYIAFSRGRPDLDVDLFLSEQVQTFLDRIWQRFGNLTVEQLNTMSKKTEAYKNAIKQGHRSEIDWEDMCRSFDHAKNVPGVDQVVRPKIMRTQTGRPVRVQAWVPDRK